MIEKRKPNELGIYGIRRIGRRAGTVGYLTKYENSAKPYEFGYGTIWATSSEEAKRKLKREIKKDRMEQARLRKRL